MILQGLRKYGWTLIGLIAMLVSIYLLYNKLQNISLEDVVLRLQALNFHHWALAIVSALLSYAALAGYDRIALHHLGKHISWLFITLCSFTTYALSHNIGASVFSGALVRYRAYSSKGLSGAEIAVLVAFCSFTFILGTIFLTGLVLILRPDVINLVYDGPSDRFIFAVGCCLLSVIGLYILGSLFRLRPLKITAKIQITYPRPRIVFQQLLIGPLELLGAAGIIYAALPEAGNPGFIVVLGVFLASFTATLLINAPAGGLGVLEIIFIKGMPDMNETDVIAALIVFRLLYLIIPLIVSVFIVAVFEAQQFIYRRRGKYSPAAAKPDNIIPLAPRLKTETAAEAAMPPAKKKQEQEAAAGAKLPPVKAEPAKQEQAAENAEITAEPQQKQA